MDFPYGETLTVRSIATTTDDDGNSTTTPTEASWGPCAVWDRFSAERVDPRQAPVVVGLSIAGPRRTFGADDLIVRGGVEYQVDGLPEENTVSPFTGWDPGIVVNVKRAGVA
jgi:hypothetical protein